MRIVSQTQKRNYWVARNKIPLGYYGDSEIFKLLPRMSDFFLIGAKPGRGKSVLFRLIMWFIAQIRPILVIDWEGEDHKLSYYANDDDSSVLPPHTKPFPIKNSVFIKYPPKIIREHELRKEDFEISVVPSLYDYSSDELRGMGFPQGAAMELKRILKDYPNSYNTMDELLNFIRQFPTNDRDVKRLEKIRGFNPFHEYDYLAAVTKSSLVKYLNSIVENKQFSLTSEKSKVLTYLFSGKNVFLNFSGNIDLARVETARLIDKIIYWRKVHKEGHAPYIFIEEADRLLPRYLEDSQERKKTEYVKTVLVEAVNRARKHRLGIGACTPTISNLNRRIIANSYEKIFGEMTDKSELDEVQKCTSKVIREEVKNLKFNRYKGIREFIYLNEFKFWLKFIPYACPQRYHKE